jgi:hypothetical protein
MQTTCFKKCVERFNYSGTVMRFTGATEEVQEGGSQLLQAENPRDFSVFCNFTIFLH